MSPPTTGAVGSLSRRQPSIPEAGGWAPRGSGVAGVEGVAGGVMIQP